MTAHAASTTPTAGSGGAAFGQPVNVVGGAGFYARAQGLLGGTMNFRGITSPAASVVVQRLDSRSGTWVTAASAVANAQGAYVARWRTDHIGVFTMRAVPSASAAGARASATPPSITVTVFKPGLATWYGPGFYGKRTACGQRLTPGLVGIAHRGLPCGRSVEVLYKGRTIVVPVIDRGPFRDGATWDLTAAAAQQLGLTRTDQIGAVTLPLAVTAGKTR